MTKLKELKVAIHKAIPEIIELKFGCRILSKRWGVGIITGYTEPSKFGKGTDEHWVCSPDLDEQGQSNGGFFIDRGEVVTNLGRRITLADVLFTINSRNPEACFLAMDGAFVADEYGDGSTFTVLAKWDFNKVFEDQEQPLIDWLHKIILSE